MEMKVRRREEYSRIHGRPPSTNREPEVDEAVGKQYQTTASRKPRCGSQYGYSGAVRVQSIL